MNQICCIHSSTEKHLGCFQLLAIISNAAMNMAQHMYLWYGRTSFMCMPKSDIASSAGGTIFSFLRNHQIDLQSDCTSLHSQLQRRSASHSPHPHQHVLSLEFLVLVILIGVGWYFSVLIYISLMMKNFEHLSVSWPFKILLLWNLCTPL